MKKILGKFKHNTLFGFILGGIIFGSVVYGANVYQSGAIEYSPTDSSWGVNNVNEAINSLYSMKNELDNITSSLNNLKSIGDATAANILAGKTAVVKGSTITGTMANNGAVTKTLNAGGSYTIPAGYHNGSGKVTVNTLASQTSATATAANILKGKTAWVNGTKVTGTMSAGVTHLGTISGGTYDATGISGYQNLTADNFILAVKSIPATMAYSTSKYVDSYANGGIPDGFAPTKSYNASTGKLTYTSNIRCYAHSSSNNASAYATVTYDLYLIG